jgi:hydrogenase expression/formation protein HypD
VIALVPKERALGVETPLDALKLAVDNPGKQIVYFAVGFETTAPSTAVTLARARELGVRNFSVFCNHVTIVPPLKAILDSPDLRLSGFIGPGHVSTVVGNRPYRFVPEVYGKPIVVAGFEPLDILQSIYMLLAQLREGRCEKVFGTACTPETPIGTCMVSPEGACSAYYNFGRLHRDTAALVGLPSVVARG